MEPTEGTWGVLTNGSWNGLVGMMERRVGIYVCIYLINNESGILINFLLFSNFALGI